MPQRTPNRAGPRTGAPGGARAGVADHAAGAPAGRGEAADWDELGPEFLAYSAARNSPKWVIEQGKALDRWRDFLEGRGVYRLSDINEADVAAYAPWRQLQKYAGKPVGIPSCNRELASLKGLFTWAIRTKRLGANPCAAVPLAREHKRTKRITIIEPADFERVAALLSERWADAALAMLGSGMRWSSLAKVRAEHLDKARSVVFLSRPKGKVGLELQISPRVFSALERVAARADLDEHDSGFNNAIRKACAKARVPRWTAHHLRHTFAVTCLRNGAELRHLQQWLGHASITTTERYLHFVNPKPPPAPV